MRMEYFLIALLLVAALFGWRRVRPAEKEVDPAQAACAKQLAKEAEDSRFFRDHFVECYYGILSGMHRYQGDARIDAHCAWVTRHLSESCIRFIEEHLADQDDNGVAFNSSPELEDRRTSLEKHEAQFIRFQKGVHANVEKVRDHIFHMQKLEEQLKTWMADKSSKLQEDASKLVDRIEKEISTRRADTDKMHIEADKDPVGRPDAIVTPKVTEFRNALVELRSKIRNGCS
jgi:hypothetical protein